MRILMAAQFYPPILGGEERHVQSLSEALVRRGHTVAVATLQQPGLRESEESGGVRVERLPSTMQRANFLFSDPERRHASPFPDPETSRAFARLVADFQPDLVHSHNWMLYSYLPLKRRLGKPLVHTLHDFSLSCAIKRLMYCGQEPCSGPGLTKCPACSRQHYGLIGPPTYLANRVMSHRALRLVDRFLAVSRATAAGNGLGPGAAVQAQIIPNFLPSGFDLRQAAHHPLADQLPADGYLLFAGDLSRDKGVHVLLEAYAGLDAAPPLVLIGRKTPTTPPVLPPNVQVFHSWPHAAVLAAWQRASLALAPSVWPEPFGIVVIEAMAAGKPVIATHMGGLPDIVADGESGLLVPPGDPAALRAAVQRLLNDPALRERMGQAGRQRVELFTAEAVVPQIEQVYQDLLGSTEGVLVKGGKSNYVQAD